MRRLSSRSVPRMCRPPTATTSSCSACQAARMEATSASTGRGSPPCASAIAAASAGSPFSAALMNRVACRLFGSMPRRASAASTSGSGLPPSTMSVPRPAMFVAMVTAPSRPACATISASRSWYRALSTSCGTPLRTTSARASRFSTSRTAASCCRPCGVSRLASTPSSPRNAATSRGRHCSSGIDDRSRSARTASLPTAFSCSVSQWPSSVNCSAKRSGSGFKRAEIRSEVSTERVPTSTGWRRQ